ncbi:hypothetical protein GT031_10660 [Streptomyces sp. SID2888]|nr:hypothetical protein [Streptomyces sp. SID2888]
MGLLSETVLLPFAPARGSLWVIRQLIAEAERQYYDPATVRAELALLERRLDEGEITAEEFDREEDALLDRLEIGLGRATAMGGTAEAVDATAVDAEATEDATAAQDAAATGGTAEPGGTADTGDRTT